MFDATLRPESRETTCPQMVAPRPAYGIWLSAMIDWIGRQQERSRSRRRLLVMSDEQLKDIGLSRCTAFSEAQRHFWE